MIGDKITNAVLLVLLFIVILLVGAAACRRRGLVAAATGGLDNIEVRTKKHLDPAQAIIAKQRFISDARPDAVKFPRGHSFLFYNVHEYRDTFGVPQRDEVASLMARAAEEGVEWVGLAETTMDIESILPRYPHRLIVSNGGTHLAAAWRDPSARAVTVPTTGTRNCIMLTTRQWRAMIVHLEIGTRPRPDNALNSAENKIIRAANAAERIEQLKALITHEPDMLIGDFNFEPQDPENEWLRISGYALVSGTEPSTPFNRVDHCYVRVPIVHQCASKESVLLPVAYSDHRPLVQTMLAKK